MTELLLLPLRPLLPLLLLQPPLGQAQILTMHPCHTPVMLLIHNITWLSSFTLLWLGR